jgi:cell division septation protein DedD
MAAVIVAALAIAVAWLLGNPLDLLAAPAMPDITQTPAKPLPDAAAALPAPADGQRALIIPPPIGGSFSIAIGTYDNAHQVQIVERQLRAMKVEPYELDVIVAPGDIRRRVLIGRFATKEEADGYVKKLGPLAKDALVIPGYMERFRVLTALENPYP